MSYRIEYGRDCTNRNFQRKKPFRLAFLTFVCFLLFLLLVTKVWPEGVAAIREQLLPADKFIAAAALDDFAEDLRYGERLKQAFSDFIRNLLP